MPKRPLIIAHRGASGYLPEHSLPAKALAVGLGADYLEQDVVLSRDGVPIVLHDIHLDTVTDVVRRFPDRVRADGRFYAIDFDLAEIQQLRLHERIRPKGAEPVYPNRFPVADLPLTIPSLKEELEFVRGLEKSMRRRIGIYPEIKQPAFHKAAGRDLSGAVLAVLDQFGYNEPPDKVFLQCFDPEETQRLRTDYHSRLPIVQLLEPGQEELERAEELKKIATYANAIGPNLSRLVTTEGSTGLAARAREAGLAVHPWTFRIDDLPAGFETPEALLRTLVHEEKVEGIFTDFPDCFERLGENL